MRGFPHGCCFSVFVLSNSAIDSRVDPGWGGGDWGHGPIEPGLATVDTFKFFLISNLEYVTPLTRKLDPPLHHYHC